MSDERPEALRVGLSRQSLAAELRTIVQRVERTSGRSIKIDALAKRLHVSRSTIYAYFDGTTLPSRLTLDKLLRALDVTGPELGRIADLRDAQDDERRQRRKRLTTPPAADSEPNVFPSELPPDVRGFSGRAEQLAELDTLLRNRDGSTAVPIAVVCGAPGVGKTALVVHWANLVRAEFPGGLLYADLRGFDVEQPLDPSEVLATFLRGLGVPISVIPQGLAERSARFRSHLDQRRVLVVLDNAASDDQVRQLIPSSASSVVVVTSRNTLSGLVTRHGACRVVVNRLPLAEAVNLLRTVIGDERIDADPLGAQALAESCARLPLALGIGADLTTIRRRSSLQDLADELRAYRLELLSSGGDERTEIRTVFSWSYFHLRHDRARAFRLLGLHPGTSIDIHAFSALTGLDLAVARLRIDDLTRASLVEDAGLDRYRLHDLLREYAAELAAYGDEAERQDALTRLFDYYRGMASAAMDLVAPQEKAHRPDVPAVTWTAPELSTVEQAMRWLETERPNLLAAAECAAQLGFPRYVMTMSAILYRYLEVRAYYADSVALHGLALSAARKSGDVNLESYALYRIGVVYGRLGRYVEAEDNLTRVLVVAADSHNAALEGQTLLALAIVRMRLCRFTQALVDLEQALPIARSIANRHLEIQVLINMGFLRRQAGRYPEALGVLQSALTLAQEIGDIHVLGHVLCGLGLQYQRTNFHEEALRCQRLALELAGRTGERDLAAQAHVFMASIYVVWDRYDEALGHLRMALDIARDTGNRDLEGYAQRGFAQVCVRSGNADTGVTHAAEALDIARATGNRALEMDALNGLGEAVVSRDPSAALAYHSHALMIAIETVDRWQQARAYDGVASASAKLGRSGDSRENHALATEIYAELGYRADL